MSNLLAARAQMALSLGFHIVFAVIGMAMPVLLVRAQQRWQAHRDPLDRLLAERWAKGTAILFAIGAVSGTALSFELGLLWPTFMRHAGPIIGMPFSLEGLAFFLEAIFLGVYLYGGELISERLHLLAAVLVAVCGMASGALVIAANAWMNTPQGFDAVVHGALLHVHQASDWPTGALLSEAQVVAVRPWEAMQSPAFVAQAAHMLLAALAAVGLGVAGVHAAMLLGDRKNPFHRRAIELALPVGLVFSALVPLSGDVVAKRVARYQPVKLAALEAHWATERGAPLLVGGHVDEQAEETRGALVLPRLLSVLAFADPDAEVRGLREVPRALRPPVAVTHLAFDAMVACGLAMIGVTGLAAWLRWRRRSLWESPWALRLLAAASPLGFIAIEAGWVVTEVGRQPWIAQGMMRTADAVTPMPHVAVPMLAFGALYGVLAVVCAALLRHHVLASPTTQQLSAEGGEGIAAAEGDHVRG